MILGIDPGASGGLALLSDNGMDLEVIPMPWITHVGINVEPVRSWIIKASRVFLEDIQVRPGEGVKATKTSCVNWGRIMGIADGLSVSLKVVQAKDWQKLAGVSSRDKRERKATSVALAQRTWPQCSFMPTERCTKPSDGMAEAALIAEYGRRTNGI